MKLLSQDYRTQTGVHRSHSDNKLVMLRNKIKIKFKQGTMLQKERKNYPAVGEFWLEARKG
jgi:hypothetical protein